MISDLFCVLRVRCDCIASTPLTYDILLYMMRVLSTGHIKFERFDHSVI